MVCFTGVTRFLGGWASSEPALGFARRSSSVSAGLSCLDPASKIMDRAIVSRDRVVAPPDRFIAVDDTVLEKALSGAGRAERESGE